MRTEQLRKGKPITLTNLETGKNKMWPSRQDCAEEIGASVVSISLLTTGKQKTLKGLWKMPEDDGYRLIDMVRYNKFKKAFAAVAKLQEEYDCNDINIMGKFDDETMCVKLGVQEYFGKKHGWDGRMDGHIGFENKNEKFYRDRNLDATYQDLSDNVLMRFAEGGLGCNAVFVNTGNCAYCVIYSISRIYDLLVSKRGGNRGSAIITLEDVLSRGGKIVAMNFDRKGTYENIIMDYPGLRNTLKMSDIHPESEAKTIAREMAYYKEDTNL